jgi:hypothetical protein
MKSCSPGGGEGAHTEHHVCNPRHGGHSNQERHSLSPEGPWPNAFERNVHDACFPRHFRVPNNVIKYDGKINPRVWLEDYRLVCTAGGADDNLYNIQFLPIYLADTATS